MPPKGPPQFGGQTQTVAGALPIKFASADVPLPEFTSPEAGRRRGKWLLDHVIDPVVDYGRGVFDARPDKPGQSQIRKKIFGFPVELLLPGGYVKALAETLAGSDTPPGVHRTDGGRGTGVYEREELDRIAAERAKAEAEARNRKLGLKPDGTAYKPLAFDVTTAARAAAQRAYATGIRYALGTHRPDGRALELADLARRTIGPATPPADLAKAKIGHAVVNRLGLLGRRVLRPPGFVVLGTGISAAADTIDASVLVNVEGVDP